MTELDSFYERRASEAKAQGQALRYVATIREEGIKVSLQSVPLNSAMGT